MIWWTWSGSNRRPLPCHGGQESANYRRNSTYEPAQPAKTAQSALFAAKLLPNLPSGPMGRSCGIGLNYSTGGANFGSATPRCRTRKHNKIIFINIRGSGQHHKPTQNHPKQADGARLERAFAHSALSVLPPTDLALRTRLDVTRASHHQSGVKW